MATSGTVSFNPALDDVIEEAFERCGVQSQSGYDLQSVRRSLNILYAEWGNRGILHWEIADASVDLVAGQNIYYFNWDATRAASSGKTNANYVTNNDFANPITAPLYNVDDILNVSYRNISSSTTNPTDTSLSSIDLSNYSALANKNSTGVPSQYFLQRLKDYTAMYLYLTPGSAQASNYAYMWYIKRVETNTAAGSYENTTDVVYRFFPCMCSGLAYYLSIKIAPARTQALKLIYEDELVRAESADGSTASTYVTPKAYYPSVG